MQISDKPVWGHLAIDLSIYPSIYHFGLESKYLRLEVYELGDGLLGDAIKCNNIF